MTEHAVISKQPSAAQRIGLWLGPILFVVVLCQPVTQTMRDSAAAVVRSEIGKRLATDAKRGDSAARIGSQAERRVDEYIAARIEWFERETRHRAGAIVVAAAVTPGWPAGGFRWLRRWE